MEKDHILIGLILGVPSIIYQFIPLPQF